MASGISAAGLPVLHVQEFDTEQIWGQLEASSGPVLKQIRKRIKGLNEEIDLIDEATEIALDGTRLSAFINAASSLCCAILLFYFHALIAAARSESILHHRIAPPPCVSPLLQGCI